MNRHLPPVHEIVRGQTQPPPQDVLLRDLIDRVVRTETRLVKLMSHLGLNADGRPLRVTESER